MTQITQSDTESLKTSISLLDFARFRGLELGKAGSDYKCLCPLHSEKTPSFVITPGKNLWNCFGCGKGGDVFNLVMELDGVDFGKAVKTMREYAQSNGNAGLIAVATTKPEAIERISLTDPGTQKHILWVLEHYRRGLQESEPAQAYLKKRGVFDAVILEKTRAGFCAGDLQKFMPPENSSAGVELRRVFLEIGILNEHGQERFTNCLVFPLIDATGNVVQIAGRRITERKKEIRHLVLPHPLRGFINPEALTASHSELILCEGVFDMLSLMMAGFPNVSCTHGTNGLGNDRLQELLSSPAGKFLITFDSDTAGDAGALLLAGKLSVKECFRINLPANTDANAFLLSEGVNFKKSIQGLLAKAVLLNGKVNGQNGTAKESHIILNQEIKQETETPLINGFTELIENTGIEAEVNGSIVDIQIAGRFWKAEDFGKKISHGSIPVSLSVSLERKFYTDSLDLYSARDRERFIKGAVKKLEQDYTLIDSDMDLVFLKLRGLKDDIISGQLESKTDPLDEMTPEQRERAYALGRDPNLIEVINKHFKECGLVGESANALLLYLLGVSRLLSKPLHVKVISSAGAGKSMLLDMALGFCPPESLLRFTSLSANALFYMNDLKHKVLLIEEDIGIEARFPLKMLQSEGRLTRGTVIKDPTTGKHVMLEVDTEGPASTLTSSTGTEILDEEDMRVIIATIDESITQTSDILEMQRIMETTTGMRMKINSESIIQIHHDFQRLLKHYTVINPFALKLKYMAERHRSRRDFPKFLTLIKTLTLLFQMQRKTKAWHCGGHTKDVLISTIEDNLLGVRIARKIIGSTLDEMAPHTRNFMMQFYELVQEMQEAQKLPPDKCRPFCRDLESKTGLSRSQVTKHLLKLQELEYVFAYRDEKRRNRYELLYDGQGHDGKVFIPGIPEEAELKKILVNLGKELRKKARSGQQWWDPNEA